MILQIGYDHADQLTAAVVRENNGQGAILKQYYYAYDRGGNRLSAQEDQNVSQFAANSLNQLKARPAGGPVRFQGSISAAGSVTINGQPAAVTVNGQSAQVTNEFNGSNPRHIFAAEPLLANGTNLVTITATDANNNVRSQQYSVEVSGAGATEPTYDDDGNMLTNGSGQTYTWDAESRLISIGYADGAATRFQYDALGRRVCIVERDNADAIVTEKRLLWHGYEIIEERDGANAVTRRYHTHGFTIPGTPMTKYYTTTDHLGSVREILEQDGALDARFDYDPYGVRTAISGSPAGIQYEFGYTGHYYHVKSGLHLAPYRANDAELGRWISRDPIAEDGGINLYGYVDANPLVLTDALGLAAGDGAITSVAGGITETQGAGSPDLHVHTQGRGPVSKNPAYNIRPTLDTAGRVTGLEPCPRGNHPYPKDTPDDLARRLANKEWYKQVKDAISKRWEKAGQSTKSAFQALGQGLRRSRAAASAAARALPGAAARAVTRTNLLFFLMDQYIANEYYYLGQECPPG